MNPGDGGDASLQSCEALVRAYETTWRRNLEDQSRLINRRDMSAFLVISRKDLYKKHLRD